jgi:predicted DCC family thiol-disulfide oxidoreductase YuxK
LGRDNWSTWKEKFKALLVYKSLYVAIESPDSVEGRKASDQARSLIIMHMEDVYVKLFAEADTAEKVWRKLHWAMRTLRRQAMQGWSNLGRS